MADANRFGWTRLENPRKVIPQRGGRASGYQFFFLEKFKINSLPPDFPLLGVYGPDNAMDLHAGSSASGDAGYQKMEAISQDIQLLPEATLKEISKGLLVNFVLSCEDIE